MTDTNLYVFKSRHFLKQSTYTVKLRSLVGLILNDSVRCLEVLVQLYSGNAFMSFVDGLLVGSRNCLTNKKKGFFFLFTFE